MLDEAHEIVRAVAPDKDPDSCCMLVAAAVAGMRGLTLRHVKVGALFWPDHFAKTGDRQLSIMGGWGIACFSPADYRIYLQDEDLDDDGGFRGHTWIQDDEDRIIDLMHDVDGGPEAIYGENRLIVARWYRRPALERRVKSYWRLEMQACAKAGRKLAKRRKL